MSYEIIVQPSTDTRLVDIDQILCEMYESENPGEFCRILFAPFRLGMDATDAVDFCNILRGENIQFTTDIPLP